jgi:DNA-entry nuclease
MLDSSFGDGGGYPDVISTDDDGKNGKGSDGTENNGDFGSSESQELTVSGFASVDGIPDYSGKPYAVINGNRPQFVAGEIVSSSYEYYSSLDSLGRCGYTMACVGRDIMPTEDRESISSVTPSGWKNKRYDTSIVDGGYIYNRCHLIGFQLTGENANKNNLITGTRYLNIEGMLPFENMVADYVKETGNHVMYRVTPVFAGTNLVASGVMLEGWSVEDDGEGICFCVFAYNVQPGLTINYATGDSYLSEGGQTDIQTENNSQDITQSEYILNKNTKKIHKPTCTYVGKISASNKGEYTGSISDLISQGYSACGTCKPK